MIVEQLKRLLAQLLVFVHQDKLVHLDRPAANLLSGVLAVRIVSRFLGRDGKQQQGETVHGEALFEKMIQSMKTNLLAFSSNRHAASRPCLRLKADSVS